MVSIKSKNYFKRLAVPFKIYANYESVLKRIHSYDKSNNVSYTKSIKKAFLAVLLTTLYVFMINLASQLFFSEEKMQSINL